LDTIIIDTIVCLKLDGTLSSSVAITHKNILQIFVINACHVTVKY